MLRERASSILPIHEQWRGRRCAVEVHGKRVGPIRDSWECEQFELLPRSGDFATDLDHAANGPAMCQSIPGPAGQETSQSCPFLNLSRGLRA